MSLQERIEKGMRKSKWECKGAAETKYKSEEEGMKEKRPKEYK